MTRIYIAGHRGMVGSAIVRQLEARQASEAGRAADEAIELITRIHTELNLTDQAAVWAFMADQAPDVVILAAGRVGGIYANNTFPADFIYDNLMIEPMSSIRLSRRG